VNDHRAPAVTVRFVPILGGMELRFSSPNVRQPLTFSIPDTSRISLARQVLRDGLRELKSLVVSRFDGVRVVDEGLPEIADVMAATGWQLISQLCGRNKELINGLQKFWREAVWQWDNPARPPAVIEYVGHPEYVIPIEHMPLFDLAGCGRPTTDPNAFVAQCRAFVGFSCVVRRRLLLDNSISQCDDLRPAGRGKVVMRFLRHAGLKGAETEYDWLTSDAKEQVDVLGPFPAEAERAVDIVEQIFDPRWLPGGRRRSDPEQIQHFSCHCDTTRRNPLDYELRLRGSGSAEVRVRVRDLDKHFPRLSGAAWSDVEMPLVVLNACGTSATDPVTATSFPRMFLENGNRAVIGTEVAMPDHMAATFSQRFYELFLLKGTPLGLAVNEARNHMLTESRNPLGLAYSVYGNTDLRIVNGVDSG
jgi:hypothetical protein